MRYSNFNLLENITVDYKVTISPALEETSKSITFLFKTRKELDAAISSCADLLLFTQDEIGVMPDYSNMFVSEEKINGVWEEIEH